MDKINPQKAATYIIAALYKKTHDKISDEAATAIYDAVQHINENMEYFVSPTCSPETIEHARYDMHRFGWVARDNNGIAYLHEKKPKFGGRYWSQGGENTVLPDDQYPEVQPGQCVALEGIVGGGQDG